MKKILSKCISRKIVFLPGLKYSFNFLESEFFINLKVFFNTAVFTSRKDVFKVECRVHISRFISVVNWFVKIVKFRTKRIITFTELSKKLFTECFHFKFLYKYIIKNFFFEKHGVEYKFILFLVSLFVKIIKIKKIFI